jgi:hypothetical protein
MDLPEPGVLDVLAPLATRTASGATPVIEGFGFASRLRIRVASYNIQSVSLPISMAYFVEDTHDGVLWNVLGNVVINQGDRIFPMLRTIDVVTPFTDRIRFRWELRGATTSAQFDAICYSE